MKRLVGAFACALVGVNAFGQLRATTVASGFLSPLQYAADPADPSRSYVVEQGGTIKTLVNGAVQGGNFFQIPAEDLSIGGERGLLGIAFAPDYASTGHVYANFTDENGSTQISRFTRVGNQLDYSSRMDILNIAQPFGNHNGGTLRFGADGFLYIGMGDGGSANDPGNRAQDPNTLLGKMLRINPNGDDFPSDPTRNYSIPPDNPFFGGDSLGAMDEIWGFGLRNPFKWSFDSFGPDATNALIIGDVGQNAWEEIDYEPAGAGGRNYGWVVREGAHETGFGSAAYGPLIDPIWEYSHSEGQTVIGGHVYRGSALPTDFKGRYFFGDFISARMWSIDLSVDSVTGEATAFDLMEHTGELAGLGMISSIDIDLNGELYVTEYGGRVIRVDVVPEPASALALLPALLLLKRRRTQE